MNCRSYRTVLRPRKPPYMKCFKIVFSADVDFRSNDEIRTGLYIAAKEAAKLFRTMEPVPQDRNPSPPSGDSDLGTLVTLSPLDVSVEIFSLILEAAEDRVDVSSFKEADKHGVCYFYHLRHSVKTIRS